MTGDAAARPHARRLIAERGAKIALDCCREWQRCRELAPRTREYWQLVERECLRLIAAENGEREVSDVL